MPGQRLVDRIVRNLEHHVVEARTVVGIADIHAGALAHGVEALEHLDRVGAIFVFVLLRGGVRVLVRHAEYIGMEGGERKRNAL
jgi:hypothetical protein